MIPKLEVQLGGEEGELEIILPGGGSVRAKVPGTGALIYHLLQAQRAGGKLTLGTEAVPTQQMVEEWLKKNKTRKFTEGGKAEKEEITLEDLGLA